MFFSVCLSVLYVSICNFTRNLKLGSLATNQKPNVIFWKKGMGHGGFLSRNVFMLENLVARMSQFRSSELNVSSETPQSITFVFAVYSKFTIHNPANVSETTLLLSCCWGLWVCATDTTLPCLVLWWSLSTGTGWPKHYAKSVHHW